MHACNEMEGKENRVIEDGTSLGIFDFDGVVANVVSWLGLGHGQDSGRATSEGMGGGTGKS